MAALATGRLGHLSGNLMDEPPNRAGALGTTHRRATTACAR
jgi:hypothetical protein